MKLNKESEYYIVSNQGWYIHDSKIIEPGDNVRHIYKVLTTKVNAAVLSKDQALEIIDQLNKKYEDLGWKLQPI